jgi:hypothetical protein
MCLLDLISRLLYILILLYDQQNQYGAWYRIPEIRINFKAKKIFLIRLKRQHRKNVDHVPVYPNKFILLNHITSLRILTKLTILKIEKLYNSILQN